MVLSFSNKFIIKVAFLAIFVLIICVTITGIFKISDKNEIQSNGKAGKQLLPEDFSVFKELILNLPHLGELSRTYQISSFDRSGANNDGFEGKFFLSEEQDRYLIFEATGPGILSRIWMTKISSIKRMQFYFDDQVIPEIEIHPAKLFSGTVSPFLSPLVGNNKFSSGGYFCYVPFAFKKNLKIYSVGKPYFYQFSYRKFPDQSSLDKFLLKENRIKFNDFMKCSQEIFQKIAENCQMEKFNIPPNSKWEFSLKGPATIISFEIMFEKIEKKTLENVIQIIWDGEDDSGIKAPLWLLFGATKRWSDMKSFFWMTDKRGKLLCNFPMPFENSASIILTNNDIFPMEGRIKIGFSSEAPQKPYGKLISVWRKIPHPSIGKDMVLAELEGTGKLLAFHLQVEGDPANMGLFLEGDDKIFLDDAIYPFLHGTGTEDIFNAGWFFENGSFILPTHGCSFAKRGHGYSAYRNYIFDTIPFYRNFRFYLEHGPYNDVNASYESLMLFYYLEGTTLFKSDDIDFSSPLSEETHFFIADLPAKMLQGTYSTIGNMKVERSGYLCFNRSQFLLELHPENKGVILRRHFDLGYYPQKVKVFVDGAYAGDWLSNDRNAFHKYGIDEFFIPLAMTDKKERILIELENYDHSPWTSLGYEAFNFIEFFPKRNPFLAPFPHLLLN